MKASWSRFGIGYPTATTALLVAVVFGVDLRLPLGVAGGVPYVIPVAFCLYTLGRAKAEAMAGICAALTVLGVVLSPPAEHPTWMVLLNRSYAFLALGLMVAIGRLQDRVLAQNRALTAQAAALRTLYDMSADLSARLDLKALKPMAVERTRVLFGCDVAGLALFQPESRELAWDVVSTAVGEAHPKFRRALSRCVASRIIEENEPVLLTDCEGQPDTVEGLPPPFAAMRSIVGAPMRIADETVGALVAGDARPAFFRPEDVQWLASLADHVAVAVNNARLYERLAAVSVMEERERLARELHDGIAQTLGYVGLSAVTATELLDRRRVEEARQHLARLQEVAEGAKQDIRESIQGLRLSRHLAPELEGSPEACFRRIGEEEQVTVRFRGDGNGRTPRLAPAVAVQVVRIVQEALRNVRRHAGVAEAEVRLETAPPWIVIEVEDRGRGFDPERAEAAEGHFGIRTMRERAQSVGGEFRVVSGPGRGTSAQLRIPYEEENG